MEKIILISIDDGTVYDRTLISLLNRRGIPATFNLNSGLSDFVWHFEGLPVIRPNAAEVVSLYEGHEVASHTLHHPCLTGLDTEALEWEIGQDCRNLMAFYGLDEIGFAVPFTACGEREIGVLRQYCRYVRLSQFREDFLPPADPYHIYGTAMMLDEDLEEKLCRFEASHLPRALFVLCGHSYEPEALGQWQQVEALLDRLLRIPGVRFMTTMEYVKEYLP